MLRTSSQSTNPSPEDFWTFMLGTRHPVEDFQNGIFYHLEVHHLSDKDLFTFLRQVAMFQHIVLQIPITTGEGFVDWDDVLSMKSQNIIPERSSFVKIKMPDNFLFLWKMYKLHMHEFKEDIYLDLLSGKLTTLKFVNSKYTYIARYMNDALYGAPGLFLGIGGRMANSARLVDLVTNRTYQVDNFYLTKNKEPNIGFSKGDLVFFDDAIYTRVLDRFLSGELVKEVLN